MTQLKSNIESDLMIAKDDFSLTPFSKKKAGIASMPAHVK